MSQNLIFDLTQAESLRQKNTLNLIASENYPSPKVLELLGSVWSNKYAEGYPGKRYYAGNVNTDKLETLVQQKALEVFDKTGEYEVNVQVLSGSPANAMVFLTVLNQGDTILSLNLANGGHLSHLHATSRYLKFFNLVNYDVKEVGGDDFEVDLEDFKAKLLEHRPKLTIIGFSAYPKSYKFAEMCKVAHEAGSLVLADIAHINGLVAAELHDSPFKSGSEGADFVTMTTHKTFRGPRGAMLFSKKEHSTEINKTIFPGTSGGPHMNKIAAIGQALLEILGEDIYPDKVDFKTYSQNVISTCKALENGLKDAGLGVVSPTQNHLCLVRLPAELDSLEVQRHLESLGIITNRNSVPFDTKTPWKPSGVRFGTAALTSRGLTVDQAFNLGKLIGQITLHQISDTDAENQVIDLVNALNWWY
ncbi:MAG: serine hydroxymethyltransferase [Patescibacteria group bacterium]